MILRNVRSKRWLVSGSRREDLGGGETAAGVVQRSWAGQRTAGGLALASAVSLQSLDNKQTGCFLTTFGVSSHDPSLDQP